MILLAKRVVEFVRLSSWNPWSCLGANRILAVIRSPIVLFH